MTWTRSRPVTGQQKVPVARDQGTLMGRAVVRAVGRASIPALVGYILHLLRAPQALPFLGYACGVLGVQLVINLSNGYNAGLSVRVDVLCEAADRYLEKHPKTSLIGLLAALVLAWISGPAAAALGACVGAFSALATRNAECIEKQEGHDGAFAPIDQHNVLGLLGFRQ